MKFFKLFVKITEGSFSHLEEIDNSLCRKKASLESLIDTLANENMFQKSDFVIKEFDTKNIPMSLESKTIRTIKERFSF